MRVQNLRGEGRRPSFLFLVYPDTGARDQQTPGQGPIRSWSNMRSAVWPKGRMARVAGKSQETPFLSWPHRGSLGLWEMMGHPVWGRYGLLGWAGCWGFHGLICYISIPEGPQGLRWNRWEPRKEKHDLPGIVKLEHAWQSRHQNLRQGLTRKLV